MLLCDSGEVVKEVGVIPIDHVVVEVKKDSAADVLAEAAFCCEIRISSLRGDHR